jgi:hypothetical protein
MRNSDGGRPSMTRLEIVMLIDMFGWIVRPDA